MQLMRLTLGIVLLLMQASAWAAGVKATWINQTANTPDTAYEWNDPGNWENGTVAGERDTAVITPTARIYVRLPAGLVLYRSTLNENVMLLGDRLTYASYNGSAAGFTGGNYFCDIAIAENETVDPYQLDKAVQLAGRLVNPSGRRMTLSYGFLHFRFDRYALTADEDRSDDLAMAGANFGVGNQGALFYAPVCSAQVSGTWRYTKGSPYLYRTSSTAHAIVVGTEVSGDAMPDGAFVKHVFDNATIELSKPVAAESGEGEVVFAAFCPAFTASFDKFYSQGAECHLGIWKKDDGDSMRIEIERLVGESSSTAFTFGRTGSADYGTAVPGTLVLHEVSGKVRVQRLQDCHLEFAGTATLPTTVFPATRPFVFENAAHVARLTVPEGIEGIIESLSSYAGKIVKDGEGRLTIGLCDLANVGKLSVEAGTAVLVRADSAAEGELSIGELAVGASGRFEIPAGGLRVSKLTLAAGATIGGSGAILVTGEPFDLAGVTIEEGATVSFAFGTVGFTGLRDSAPEGEVVGHPAFWVDAQKESSLVYATEGGKDYVTRWNDCRAGETMFCTNFSLRPTYVKGSYAHQRYVRLAQHYATKYTGLEQLAWSRPIDGIKAVFLVCDASEGGGDILGRCSWRLDDSYYGSQGGPFYRNADSNPEKPFQASPEYATPCVRYGTFYRNGCKIDPVTTGYEPGTGMQVVEAHINSQYRAGAGHYDLCCDAFGCGYRDNTDMTQYVNGRQRIAECIIYTNELTFAEREKVAQYLSRKWRDCDIAYSLTADAKVLPAVTAVGETYEVVTGSGTAVGTVTGGRFGKSGGGFLYVDGIDGEGLRIDGGTVVVNSFWREGCLPNDAWVHFDAMAEDTVTKGTDDVLSRWSDVRGTGLSLRGCWGLSKVKYVASAINGKPGITLGPTTSGNSGGALRTYKANGEAYGGYNGADSMEVPLVRTALVVYNSEPGGGSVFGAHDDGYPGKGFPHAHSKGEASPVIDAPGFLSTSSFGLGTLSNAIAAATAVFRRNGTAIDPFVAPFLMGDELLAFRYGAGRRVRDYGNFGYSDRSGGLVYGEILLFPRLLSDAELERAEAYLNTKWFGVKSALCPTARCDTLEVGVGSALEIRGAAPLAAKTVSGGGTVTGDIVVSQGLRPVVTSDGLIGQLTVSGVVTLPADGRIVLAGNVRALQPGSYRLLSATTLTGGTGTWTVEGPSRRFYGVSVQDNALVLTVTKGGLCVILR